MNAKAWLRGLLYLVIAYSGLVGMLLFFENHLVFPATKATSHWLPVDEWERDPKLRAIASPRIEDVELTCADGTKIHAWWCRREGEGSDQAILYCHGNGGNLSHRGGSIMKLRALMKMSVLIIDYPGYGKSEGRPTEQGCYQAADAGYAWLTEQQGIAPKKLLLYGASLGGGVAVEQASRKEHRALVLVKTFTSIPDVACDIYWFLPVPIRSLMSNRFESVDRLHACKRPVFIAHSATDDLIPHAHGERLFAAANAPKRFFSMSNGGHNDSLPIDFFTALDTFLREHPVD